MNAGDVLMYGHREVLNAVDGLPGDAWEQTGVCGAWSVKDVVAHLASYELVLVDILASVAGDGPTPCLDEFRQTGAEFNNAQVARRQGQTAAETLAKYTAAHAQVRVHASAIAAETWRQAGLLPWYGAEYSLDDVVVYLSYGHKREHGAQIAVHRGRLNDEAGEG